MIATNIRARSSCTTEGQVNRDRHDRFVLGASCYDAAERDSDKIGDL
jgi:hypothetical protein